MLACVCSRPMRPEAVVEWCLPTPQKAAPLRMTPVGMSWWTRYLGQHDTLVRQDSMADPYRHSYYSMWHYNYGDSYGYNYAAMLPAMLPAMLRLRVLLAAPVTSTSKAVSSARGRSAGFSGSHPSSPHRTRSSGIFPFQQGAGRSPGYPRQ